MVLAGDHVNTNYGANNSTGDIFYLRPFETIKNSFYRFLAYDFIYCLLYYN